MNLFMFSSVFDNNTSLNKKIMKCINKQDKPTKIGIITAQTELSSIKQTCLNYIKIGFDKIMSFDIGYMYNESKIDELLSCDAIHIMGGNTFKINKLLHLRKLHKPLRIFAQTKHKVLLGNSAGAIIMSENIKIAEIADENNCCFKKSDFEGLNLVPFDIKPHYQLWDKMPYIFYGYSNYMNKTLFCLNDGEAIVVLGHNILYANNVIPKLRKIKKEDGYKIDIL